MSQADETSEDIRAQVEARVKDEADKLTPKDDGDQGKAGGPDDPRFILDCLGNNERGDGVMFAALHRERFVFEKVSQRWMEFPPGGHHWQIDKMGKAITAVEQVALKYQERADALSSEIRDLREERAEAEAKEKQAKKEENLAVIVETKEQIGRLDSTIERLTNKRKALSKRVDRLRSVRGANNCLQWAHSIENPLAILNDQIDQNPLLFACGNGVIDLEIGRLRKGTPSDWLVKASPINLPDGIDHYLITGDDCPCPVFHKTVCDVLGDEEVADFVHRLFGYAMTGLSVEHIATVAIGEGRNGKGTIFEILQKVFGDFAWVVSPELILEQKNARASSGAAADLVAIAGRRMIIGSETDENRKISGSAVKQLTGGDTIKARPLYQADEINIAQTWKLFLHTNHVPKGLTSDFALLQRLVYIKFPFLYVDNPEAEAKIKPALADQFKVKDRTLPGQLAKELPGILAWLVRGCLRYQKEGLLIPDRIRADVETLRNDEDVVGQFVAQRCIRTPESPTTEVLLKSFYASFKEWYIETTGDKVPSTKWLSKEMVKRGYNKDARSGQVRLYGIRLRDMSDPEDVTEMPY